MRCDALQDDLVDYVAQELGNEDGILVVDETGFLKKGQSSAGAGAKGPRWYEWSAFPCCPGGCLASVHCYCAAASATASWLITCAMPRVERHSMYWFRLPACAGPLRNASKRPREKSDWISTKCAAGMPGIGTSRCRCLSNVTCLAESSHGVPGGSHGLHSCPWTKVAGSRGHLRKFPRKFRVNFLTHTRARGREVPDHPAVRRSSSLGAVLAGMKTCAIDGIE